MRLCTVFCRYTRTRIGLARSGHIIHFILLLGMFDLQIMGIIVRPCANRFAIEQGIAIEQLERTSHYYFIYCLHVKNQMLRIYN